MTLLKKLLSSLSLDSDSVQASVDQALIVLDGEPSSAEAQQSLTLLANIANVEGNAARLAVQPGLMAVVLRYAKSPVWTVAREAFLIPLRLCIEPKVSEILYDIPGFLSLLEDGLQSKNTDQQELVVSVVNNLCHSSSCREKILGRGAILKFVFAAVAALAIPQSDSGESNFSKKVCNQALRLILKLSLVPQNVVAIYTDKLLLSGIMAAAKSHISMDQRLGLLILRNCAKHSVVAAVMRGDGEVVTLLKEVARGEASEADPATHTLKLLTGQGVFI